MALSKIPILTRIRALHFSLVVKITDYPYRYSVGRNSGTDRYRSPVS